MKMRVCCCLMVLVSLSILVLNGGCGVDEISGPVGGGGNPTRSDGAKYIASGTSFPVWMPDGKHILKTGEWTQPFKAIVKVPGDMEVIPSDIGYRLSQWGRVDFALGDGVIAVSAYDTLGGDNLDLFLVSLHDMQLTRLTHTPLFEGAPKWSPDNTRIAFDYGDADSSRIEIIDPEDGSRVVLAGGPNKNWWPAWSPDGMQIAFTSDRSGIWQVWTVAVNGGELKQLTDMEVEGTMHCPSWSPNGDRIAFGAEGGIWIVEIGGGEPVLFASNANGPAWSPLGGRIAFAGDWSYGGHFIWSLAVN